jgi:hypothetical protein
MRNVDYLPPSGQNVITAPPGPTDVQFLDKDLGIFRVSWILSPVGDIESFIPCHLVGQNEQRAVPTRNLKLQSTHSMGAGMRMGKVANGIFLRKKMEFKALMTIIPAAPNNKRRYHVETLDPKQIKKLFRTNLSIDKGVGPPLEIFIQPSEATARYAWKDDGPARTTIGQLLGLDKDDPNEAGIEQQELPGFQIANKERELKGHSQAVAAEALTPFADNTQGTVATTLDAQGIKLKGNMVSSAIAIGKGAVIELHEFPGQAKPTSRMALMPESVRQLVSGILPLGKAEK